MSTLYTRKHSNRICTTRFPTIHASVGWSPVQGVGLQKMYMVEGDLSSVQEVL